MIHFKYAMNAKEDNMKKKNIQIAIDGYCGCGKSTLAQNVATLLGFQFIPSGILYRLATLRMLELAIAPYDIQEQDLSFLNHVKFLKNKQIQDSLGIVGIHDLKNLEAINHNVAIYAQNPLIRNTINHYIRMSKKEYSSIIEGRDIGSVVLPDADLKYFLYGSIDYRIRCWEIGEIRRHGSFDPKERDALYYDSIARDKEDETRELDPLVCTDDAIRIDVEQLHGQQLLEKVLEDIRNLNR